MKTIAYCLDCAEFIFSHNHCYTVDVTQEFEWMGNTPIDRELTPADEEFRDGTSYDICSICGHDSVLMIDTSDEVAEILLEAKKEHGSISIALTEEEMGHNMFTDATRLKKEIVRQSL